MRRKISLFIGGMEVDLQDETFLLFNYTMEDMSNPTTVRNSYSQQITVKGTPQNNKIFGHIWKTDRQTQYGGSQSGVYFDPTDKTSFTIYNEMNEILESGYCKLDQISRVSGQVEYKISLFGGLGSFMYNLAFDGNGNRKSLASLKYTGQYATDDELNFTINATSVKNAWKRLGGDTSVSDLWDIINFAPAYNGFPGGLFDADKALIHAETAGLEVPDEFITFGGYVLATLPKKYTEWEAKDLRSYLQRPVVRMKSIIDAACQSYNNGGYSVTLDSGFFNSSNPYYTDTWLTLPLTTTMEIDIQDGGGNLSPHIGTYVLPEGGDLATDYIVNLTIKPALTIQDPTEQYYQMHYLGWGTEYYFVAVNYIRYTLKAYDSQDNLLRTTQVRASTFQANIRIPDAPEMDYVATTLDSNGVWVGDPIRMSVEARGISYIVLERMVVGLVSDSTLHQPNTSIVWHGGGLYSNHKTVTAYGEQFPQNMNTETWITSNNVRSGVTLTKKLLLSSDRTPADYLLSYCKMFGLVFLSDKTTKHITIMPRGNFYRNDVVDLTGRINLGEGITMLPYTFDAKWYAFGHPYDNGEYAQYYANIYDRVFGVQRVNTGYAFNAETRDLLEGTVFRGACEVLENSKYFVDITDEGKYLPAVFQDAGGTYTLDDGTGKTVDFRLPFQSLRAVRSWWNEDHKSYDIFPKVQFHNADNAGYEERDTLLFFRGMKSLSGITTRIAITDDTSAMINLNDNTPCWILDWQETHSTARVTSLPMFSRYKWDDNTITKSLDFGTPGEVAIPDVTFDDGSSIYDQYWQKYIRDRYDDDSRVMTCKVNLAGFQVNEDLFRQFYWYDGSVWALNRIINHCLSTWDDTECEFVKVQDIYNY